MPQILGLWYVSLVVNDLDYYLNIEGGEGMKKGYRIFTVLFVVGVMIMTGGSAMAAWVSGAGNSNVAVGATSSGKFSAKTATSPVFSFAGEVLPVPESGQVVITLTGGALFSGAPTMTSDSGVLLTCLGSPVGLPTATFLVDKLLTSPAAITFNSAASGFINVGGLIVGSNVDILLSTKNVYGLDLIAPKSLSAVTGMGFAFTGVNMFVITASPLEDTVDVGASSGAYTRFEANSLAGKANFVPIDIKGWSVPSAKLPAKKAVASLKGDFTGISGVACSADFVGSDSAGLTTGGVAGQFLINAAKTEAYAVNLNELGAAKAIALNPIFSVDGTTSQNERSFTLEFKNLDDAMYAPNTWLSSTKFYSLKRNGVFFSANSIGGYNTIKISDTNGKVPASGAKVLISAWDTAGVPLAEVSGTPAILLTSNQTITLTGDQIAARFVGSAMKYEVAIESTSAVITNVKKTPDGFGSTVYKGGGSGGGV
jgi:hypothetical protein